MQSSQLDWETSNKNQTSNVEDAIRNSETDSVCATQSKSESGCRLYIL